MNQKWINEGGIYFPISGNVTLHPTPGPGVWKVAQGSGMDKRLGLVKVCDKFEFDYKIYDTGGEPMIKRVKSLWNNEKFENTGKNLGIIFNGNRGCGKTICSKLLCNELDQPTIIIDNTFEGAILDFICSLEFECTIFLDEAEKTFTGEDSTILLKLIDGVYNASRKLYLLTTNRLTVNENLLGRPGRIRYIQEFNNLPKKTIEEIVDDLLEDKSKRANILSTIELLDMATIDIIKALIEEVNITGEDITEYVPLNIPRAANLFDTICFNGLDENDIPKVTSVFKNCPENESLKDWIESKLSSNDDRKGDYFEEETKCDFAYTQKITSSTSFVMEGSHVSIGQKVTYEQDDDGFFVVEDYDGDPVLVYILGKKNNKGLYRGKLSMVF